jgi:uncharacterized membrane protein YvlD (DUF360 family)
MALCVPPCPRSEQTAPVARDIVGRLIVFLERVIANAVALFLVAYFVPGITYGNAPYGYGEADKYISLLLTATVLAVVNTSTSLVNAVRAGSAPAILLNIVVSMVTLVLLSLVQVTGFRVESLQATFLAAVALAIVGFGFEKLLVERPAVGRPT